MQALAPIFTRPIAHRGLHNAARAIVENSISAARAAIAAGYGIECDVQLSQDGDVVVFHDDALERLTQDTGLVREKSGAQLRAQKLNGGDDHIPGFDAFLGVIAGRAPLVVEIKSAFDGETLTAQRVAESLAFYDGPVAIKSFDPAMIAFLRAEGRNLNVSHIPLGVVAEAHYDTDDWSSLSARQRQEMTHFLHYPRTRPDFVSWSVNDLPNAIPFLARAGLHLPVMTWTVRTQAHASLAAQWADQIVFEGFDPA